jgi:dual specificity MAP kinase phosphatase
MGNLIVLPRDPPPLDYLLGKRVKRDGPREDTPEPPWNSYLFFWQFARSGSSVVCNAIPYVSKENFDLKCCYVVLHVYRLHGKVSPVEKQPGGGPNVLQLLENLVQSAKECLSPRGVSTPVGTSAFISTVNLPTGNKELYHDVYVWNGRESHQLVRATARAKALKMDLRLRKHNVKILRTLFYRENPVALSEHFSIAIDLEDDYQNLLLSENRLFSQLLYQAVSGNPQFLPSYSQNDNLKTLTDKLYTTSSSGSGSTVGAAPGSTHASAPAGFLPAPPNITLSHSNPNLGGAALPPMLLLSQKVLDREYREDADGHSGIPNAPLSSRSPRPGGQFGGGGAGGAGMGGNMGNALLPGGGGGAEPMPRKGTSDSIIRAAAGTSSPVSGSLIEPPAPPRYKPLVIPADGVPILDAPSRYPGEPEGDDWRSLQHFYLGVCSHIASFIFLGSRNIASDFSALTSNGITHVLNCAGGAAEAYFPGKFKYRVMWLLDGPKEDIASLFYHTAEFIEDARQSNGRVFIHCEKGISRSSTMAISYLMWKNNLEYYPTMEAVKRIRKVASPNANFMSQLLEWSVRRRTPVTTARVFLVTIHNTDDKTWVAKHLTGKQSPNFTTSMLVTTYVFYTLFFGLVPLRRFSSQSKELCLLICISRSNCYLIETSTCFYVWNGKQAPAEAVDEAKKIVALMQKYESVSPAEVKVIQEGDPEMPSATALGLKA